MTTTEPNPPRIPEPDPGRDRLLHWLITGGMVFVFLGYLLHQHPAYRETAAALGSIGSPLLATVLAARGRR